MRIGRIGTTLATAAVLIAAYSPIAHSDASEVKVGDLFTYGFTQDCVDYTIEKLVFRMGFSGVPPRVRLALSFQVSYYQPDAVVMLYDKIGQEPWREWQKTMGKVLNKIENPLLQLFFNADGRGGANAAPMQANTNERFIFKYADIFASPVPMMLNLLSEGRFDTAKYLGDPGVDLGTQFAQIFDNPQADAGSTALPNESQESQSLRQSITAKAQAYLQQAKQKAAQAKELMRMNPQQFKDMATKAALDALNHFGGIGGDLGKMLGELGALKNASSKVMQKLQQAVQIIRAGANLIGFGGGDKNPFSNQFNFFCPSSIMPFDLYFISAINPMGWRMGLPDALSAAAWNSLDASQVIGSNPVLDRWGRIMPRQGYIAVTNDNRASAVLATRAMSIIVDGGKYVHKALPGNEYVQKKPLNSHAKWQMLYPTKSKSCRAFADQKRPYQLPPEWQSELKNNRKKRFMYQYWRQYRCELNPKYQKFWAWDWYRKVSIGF